MSDASAELELLAVQLRTGLACQPQQEQAALRLPHCMLCLAAAAAAALWGEPALLQPYVAPRLAGTPGVAGAPAGRCQAGRQTCQQLVDRGALLPRAAGDACPQGSATGGRAAYRSSLVGGVVCAGEGQRRCIREAERHVCRRCPAASC